MYYLQLGDTFLFGSEIKALLAHPGYRVDVDREALLEYFTFQNFFTSKTLFRGVSLLPAGTFMEVGERVGEPQRFWDFSFQRARAIQRTESEYLEELDRLFRQAVSRQLVADVPVGSYLSGGTDSGSIAALAAAEIEWLHTFTVGFDLHSASGLELAFDERERAEHLSYLLKTEHYEMVLKAGDIERVMGRLVWHLEEPRVGQSYPNFYAAQLASKFVTVALSGAGGDELFGGYPWRYYRAVVNDDFEHYVDKYYRFWQRLMPNTHDRTRVRADQRRRWRRVDARHLPRRVRSPSATSSRVPRTTSTTHSISRRRRSCTVCWWSRTSCRWPTVWRPGCRSSTTTWSTSPSASRSG